MGYLDRLLRFVPKAERTGIHLDDPHPWEVAGTRDVERVLRAVPLLAPAGSIAYFEDTGEAHVARYLEQVAVPGVVQVAVGTLWPAPDRYHVPLTADTMESMAAFLEEHPAGFFCSHFHVYHESSVLLQWHDAFMDDPLYLSRAIPEDVVEQFVRQIGSRRLAT